MKGNLQMTTDLYIADVKRIVSEGHVSEVQISETVDKLRTAIFELCQVSPDQYTLCFEPILSKGQYIIPDSN